MFRTTVHESATAPLLKTFWELESLGIRDPIEGDSLDGVTKSFEEGINKVCCKGTSPPPLSFARRLGDPTSSAYADAADGVRYGRGSQAILNGETSPEEEAELRSLGKGRCHFGIRWEESFLFL